MRSARKGTVPPACAAIHRMRGKRRRVSFCTSDRNERVVSKTKSSIQKGSSGAIRLRGDTGWTNTTAARWFSSAYRGSKRLSPR
eukprot:4831438-Prymnesium_polylepis.1